MSKVDLARRGILGLRSLLKEAPAKNLPATIPRDTPPLSTLPSPTPTQPITEAELNKLAEMASSPLSRRSVVKGIASQAVPTPKIPLKILSEITSAATPTTPAAPRGLQVLRTYIKAAFDAANWSDVPTETRKFVDDAWEKAALSRPEASATLEAELQKIPDRHFTDLASKDPGDNISDLSPYADEDFTGVPDLSNDGLHLLDDVWETVAESELSMPAVDQYQRLTPEVLYKERASGRKPSYIFSEGLNARAKERGMPMHPEQGLSNIHGTPDSNEEFMVFNKAAALRDRIEQAPQGNRLTQGELDQQLDELLDEYEAILASQGRETY